MKKEKFLYTLLLSIVLLFNLLSGSAVASEEYIPVHSEEELNTLFEQVKDYMTENKDEIDKALGETENALVSSAFVRAWGITQYEDASPKQIDDAYDALFNSFLFTGLIVEWSDTLFTDEKAPETMFMLAKQVIDQEYYDLLAAEGDTEEEIKKAKKIRDEAEELADAPDKYSEEEKEALLSDIFSEVYMASGLRSIAHTKVLPTPEELFPDAVQEENDTSMVNPMIEYENTDEINKMLGIQMPELDQKFECTPTLYGIIADVVADVRYNLGDGTVMLRASTEAGVDISGVYGAEFLDDWNIYSTEIEIDKYQKMLIAKGTVQISSDEDYSFAIDAEDIDMDTFEDIVYYVVESFRNQSKQ